MDFYFNHVDILETFIMYFKEKAQTLIKQALAQQIVIPKDMTGIISVDHIGLNKKNILSNIKPKKYILDIVNHSKKYLTPKEYEVLRFYYRGYSMKEIAGFLNVSARTVEDHINNIKRKLGIIRKFELIEFIASLNSYLF
ncbi:MAG: helix-turn-helix transcriptional regulator [Proteobacteria bacterium]|nr:helix-turn-helix transcriptional regulator [Pseudomonadota bacterium]